MDRLASITASPESGGFTRHGASSDPIDRARSNDRLGCKGRQRDACEHARRRGIALGTITQFTMGNAVFGNPWPSLVVRGRFVDYSPGSRPGPWSHAAGVRMHRHIRLKIRWYLVMLVSGSKAIPMAIAISIPSVAAQLRLPLGLPRGAARIQK